MMKAICLFFVVAGGACFAASVRTAEAAAAKCTSIQARCAVQIGGTCDPATGHWVYGRRGVGGTNKSGAFDACVSAGLAKRKR